MNQEEIILAAQKRQKQTGTQDAEIAIVIRGKWPNGGKKRLAGRAGPFGQCIAEYEDSVLCLFKADQVISFLTPQCPAHAPNAPNATAPA